MTYSLVALDPETGELGAAVQSHYFAVGRRCLTVVPGVAAIASQALGSAAHGPLLSAALRAGTSPEAALREVLQRDDNPALRQVAVASPDGTAAHTGSGCIPIAAHAVGTHAVAVGNTLTGPHPEVMLAAFEGASGPLEQRLLAALDAAQEAGGDSRGVMSAALVVASGAPVEHRQDGTRLDVRVDHHADPLRELRRLVGLGVAHRELATGVLAAGRLVGVGADRIGPADGERLLGRLGAVQDVFGDDLEPTFWRGVVALRLGRRDEAAAHLGAAIAARPEYAALAERLASVGRLDLPAGGLAELLPAAPHPPAPPGTTPSQGDTPA